jgi:hypothetical protein
LSPLSADRQEQPLGNSNWSLCQAGAKFPKPWRRTSPCRGSFFCTDLEFWFDILWDRRITKAVKLSPKDLGVCVSTRGNGDCHFANSGSHRSTRSLAFKAPQTIQERAPTCSNPPNLDGQHSLKKMGTQSDGLLASWSSTDSFRSCKTSLCQSRRPGDRLRLDRWGSKRSYDKMLRPDLTTSVFEHRCQIFTMDSRLKSWDFFRRSLDLLSLLESKLFCNTRQEPPRLQKNLGQLETAGSIASNSSML